MIGFHFVRYLHIFSSYQHCRVPSMLYDRLLGQNAVISILPVIVMQEICVQRVAPILLANRVQLAVSAFMRAFFKSMSPCFHMLLGFLKLMLAYILMLFLNFIWHKFCRCMNLHISIYFVIDQFLLYLFQFKVVHFMYRIHIS